MPFVVITRDKPGSLERRIALREEHLAYLDANRHRLLAAGARPPMTARAAMAASSSSTLTTGSRPRPSSAAIRSRKAASSRWCR